VTYNLFKQLSRRPPLREELNNYQSQFPKTTRSHGYFGAVIAKLPTKSFTPNPFLNSMSGQASFIETSLNFTS
jgi:hypothetical protein